MTLRAVKGNARSVRISLPKTPTGHPGPLHSPNLTSESVGTDAYSTGVGNMGFIAEFFVAIGQLIYAAYWLTRRVLIPFLIVVSIVAYRWFSGAPWRQIPNSAPGIGHPYACGYARHHRLCILAAYHPGSHRYARIVTRPVRAAVQTSGTVATVCGIVWPVWSAVTFASLAAILGTYIAVCRYRIRQHAKPRRVKVRIEVPKPVTAETDSVRASEYFARLHATEVTS
jgi:hypothetical protein